MKTEHKNERSAETLAVVRDIALMVGAATCLYDEMILRLGSLTHSQREEITLKLCTLNRQMLRGAEHLKEIMEEDLYTTERWCETYHYNKRHISLANALGKLKLDISSDFYIGTAFNL